MGFGASGSKQFTPWGINAVRPTSGSSGRISLVACGTTYTCVQTERPTPKLFCWGRNMEGQLGFASNNFNTNYATEVNIGGTLTALAAGVKHTCAVLATGVTKCFGSNYFGQLGDGSHYEKSTTPVVALVP